MLNVVMEPGKVIRLSGSIEGGEDLAVVTANLMPNHVLDCSGITRINSVGTKAWIRIFNEPAIQSAQILFQCLSPAMVEQLNMYRNFFGGAKILSIGLPFRCEVCKLDFNPVFKLDELEKFRTGGPDLPCPKCKGPAEFDDMPAEYLGFLTSTRAG